MLIRKLKRKTFPVVKIMEFPGKICPKKKNENMLRTKEETRNVNDPSRVRLFPIQGIFI